jgi:hypothetical protein
MAALSAGLCAESSALDTAIREKHLPGYVSKAKTHALPVHAFGKAAPKSSDKEFKSFADSRLAALNKAACLQLPL